MIKICATRLVNSTVVGIFVLFHTISVSSKDNEKEVITLNQATYNNSYDMIRNLF